MPRDLREVRKDSGLTSIKGIGSGIAEKLNELLDTGQMSYFEKLKKGLPGSLTEIIHIQGIGPKKAKLFYEMLGIETIDQLEEAVANEKLQELPGIGVKAEENIETVIGNRYSLHPFGQVHSFIGAINFRRGDVQKLL